MNRILRSLLGFLLVLIGITSQMAIAEERIPILAYHRLNPTTIKDEMTIKTSEFAEQLKWLQDNGYKVVPLKSVVNYLQGQGEAPPPKSVVITADDGHISVYKEMLPLIKKYNIPVTLFIYPSAISHASYAMTWEQLQDLQKTGLFDIQGHTYWHPNFKREKKKLSPADYQKLVDMQLTKSKSVLEQKLGIHVEYLAWPFGLYDDDLKNAAKQAGYTAAFTIDGKCATKSFDMLAQPRFMIVHAPNMKRFEGIASMASQSQTIAPQGQVMQPNNMPSEGPNTQATSMPTQSQTNPKDGMVSPGENDQKTKQSSQTDKTQQ